MSSIPNAPEPRNEKVLDYAPGSRERQELKAGIGKLRGEQAEIPVVVGGREIRTGELRKSIMPHNHTVPLATWHKAGTAEVLQAVQAAKEASREWASWRWEDRVAVFLRAADLLANSWRPILNAATMLGQSKTAHQAEIDSACELIDFWRYNAHFAQRIFAEQPRSAPGTWNRFDHRPLEGFVYAVTPFNFTAIAGNLPTAPAMLGNVVIWKPSDKAVFSGYHILKLLEAAGLPPGVISFIPGTASEITETLLSSPDLAGIHYTGSTSVFERIWGEVSDRIDGYRSYPRLVGETGGKDFILAHPSADPVAVSVAIVRGGFEYQGQKCSAASRIFIPDSLWPEIRDRTLEMIAEIRVGDPEDFRNFMGAVIDRSSFDNIVSYIEDARQSDEAEILAGGTYDDGEGFFIDPTLIKVSNPSHRLMREEIFGPVVTVYVYPDREWEEVLHLIDRSTPYGLTGGVFATSRAAILQAGEVLRNTAGNFYINDKPTGAVVGEQPFGGARKSGTNDKAGSILNLQRWISPRVIKETFHPPTSYRYPFMDDA
ncbi:MAG: L-glutamate gamma-semialdehyde dehydrogenase [Gemmatimonadota bacterium]|jgi:1-pyrroline-5-carboxylate dehydrogenase|nr:L-glutamate gamma-semialdehyde dehydrogenase [Gemmatimonadota bacterium]